MSTCPEGHQSDSDDYCDVCGTPIEDVDSAPAAAAPPPPAKAAPVGVACPNCQAENVPDALFCEACGYDFTTGTMPRPWVNPFAEPAESSAEPVDTAENQGLSTSLEEREGQPEEQGLSTSLEERERQPEGQGLSTSLEEREGSSEEQGLSTSLEEREESPEEQGLSTSLEERERQPEGQGLSTSLEEREGQPEEQGLSTSLEEREGSSEEQGLSTPLEGREGALEGGSEPAEDEEFSWVAELWVDPDWYRHQEPPDPMPSPGLPEVIPLQKRSNLVGRPSRSRGITPDIDCDSDPGASRRQAQLTTDGRRWWVEDLDSSNGTYVSGAAEGLPDRPIPVGQRHELDPDDRIYLGAWTRLVIRRATDEERETFTP